MFGIQVRRSFAVLLGLGAVSLAGAAHAQSNPCWDNGVSAGSITNVGPLFSIDTINGFINVTGPNSTLVSKSGTGITNWVMLGINAIGIVDLNGNELATAGATAGGGNVLPPSSQWNPCGTSFYSAVGNGQGFPDNSNLNWLRTGTSTELATYGKGSVLVPNQGSFSFSGIIGKTFGTDFLIGIDFAAGDPNGTAVQTGRMYFSPTSGGTTGGGGQTGTGGEVPEPGEWAAMGVLSAGLLGLMASSRRKRSA